MTGADIGAVVLVVMVLGGYFFPTIIATRRDKENTLAIFVLNLFLGWTFIGWVVALVWACTTSHPGR